MPRLLATAVSVVTAAALLGGSPAAVAAPADRFPARIDLPQGFQPEGIEIGPGPVAWLGSRADGRLVEVRLRTGEVRRLGRAPGTPAIGLKRSKQWLLVAGGPSGTVKAHRARDGRVVRSVQLTDADATFVNDLVVTRTDAWVTDSAQAQLYRVPLDRRGRPARAADVVTLPLTGEWEQGEDFGANGITQTPDGSALLVVHSTDGLLYRVDPATGEASVVDLGGVSLTNGDGMLLDGRRLYVVRNRLDRVVVLRVSRDGTAGTRLGTIRSRDFDVPTTVARFGKSLYLPNARFTTEETEDPATLDYWLTRVRAGAWRR